MRLELNYSQRRTEIKKELAVLAASFRMFDSVLEVVSGDLRCLDVNSGTISMGVLGDEGTLEMSLTLSKSSS